MDLFRLEEDAKRLEKNSGNGVALAAFEEWFKGKTVDVDNSKLTLGSCSNGAGNGIFASKDIIFDSDETTETPVILQVPRSIMISISGTVLPSEFGRAAAKDSFLTQTPNHSLLMATFLLLEKYHEPLKSQWKPYIDILPTRFSTPTFWSTNEIKQLVVTSTRGNNSHFLTKVVMNMRNYCMYYVYMFKFLLRSNLPSKVFTFPRFLWALSIIQTRQNETINPISGIPEITLVPYYDMFNHRPGPISTFYDTQTQLLETRVMRHQTTDNSAVIKAGEQVFISYGHRSNQNLLLYSGFVDPSNVENDDIKIWCGVAASYVFAKRSRAILYQCGMSS